MSSALLPRRAIAAAAFVLTASLASAPPQARSGQPPLRTGVDGTFAPHAMAKLGGSVEGFQIDLFTEAARRMKVAGKPKSEAEALGLAALDGVGLRDRAGDTPGQLSGGQAQRRSPAPSRWNRA